ncbi:SAND domain-containing protein, partial [Cynara cardunculus var. scolymus]
MANGAEERGSLVMEDGSAMFSEEEVSEISGFKRGGDDHVEVTCGCTSHCYGDAVGTLRVFASGDLEISCDCTPGCQEDKLTPAAFEKHSGRETARKWKNNIWVIVDGEKVPLSKTALLKYYNQALRKTSNRSQTGRVCHRDEFLRCTQCNKLRRFRLRTKEECRAYHDAFINDHWKCSDMPYDKNVAILMEVYSFWYMVFARVARKRNVQAGECTEGVCGRQHAKVAHLVFVSVVIPVVFPTAAVRRALTSPGTPNLNSCLN